MLSSVTASSGVAAQERTLNLGAEGIAGGANTRRGRLSSVRQEHLNEEGREWEIVSETSWLEECGVSDESVAIAVVVGIDVGVIDVYTILIRFSHSRVSEFVD